MTGRSRPTQGKTASLNFPVEEPTVDHSAAKFESNERRNGKRLQSPRKRSPGSSVPSTSDSASTTARQSGNRPRCDVYLRPGSNACFCRGCGEVFNAPAGFDLHRRGGRCMEPSSRRMELRQYRHFAAWVTEGDDRCWERPA